MFGEMIIAEKKQNIASPLYLHQVEKKIENDTGRAIKKEAQPESTKS